MNDKKLTTLQEAFKQRKEIEQAGKAIYVRGRTSGTVFAIIFQSNQGTTGWYHVLLTRPDNTGVLAMMPGDMPVFVE